MKNFNPSRALAVAAGVVIIALTGAAFWLSYAHLAEVALGHGLGQAEVRAWAWPACLDLFIIAGEIMWLRAALAHRVDLWAIGLTSVGSLGSIVLNVAGVTGARDPAAVPLLDYVVAAVPPTAALLAFGALMRQVHQALAGHVEAGDNFLSPAAPVTVERADSTNVELPNEPLPAVAPAVIELPAVSPMWDAYPTSKVTAAVPAVQPREVVTEQITITPADLRRKARTLHRQVVSSGGRGVTIDQLRDTFGLSRREATELRREVVTEVAS
ncbi:DUF2637 domain-containing protein [Streptomyces wuyuanensis]|uniref:DUF2637 domain-containing protein n=1 Tax=Streptomyces wuyuanensis TaxID=1196353 RepID=A0A1H0EFZ2_9ACTN|nr:DUF2637 domain-containing protein [Streptomyces wuyuanensis]SDN81273.1 Protein of unknown function [Streptomyces wuyuanensis]